jgi:hypothetical protein
VKEAGPYGLIYGGIWIVEDVSEMVVGTKNLACRIMAGICGLILALLLVACGGSTNSSGKSDSVNYSNSATETAAWQMNEMKTYSGNGFTIEYPQKWKEVTSGTEVTFTDPLGNYNLTVGTAPNTHGNVSASKLAEAGVTKVKTSLKNVETVTVPQTTTLAGETWCQRSFTGTHTYQGQSAPITADVLATNYPEHTSGTKGYVIAYAAVKDQFAQAQNTYFTPMLQSFKFAV